MPMIVQQHTLPSTQSTMAIGSLITHKIASTTAPVIQKPIPKAPPKHKIISNDSHLDWREDIMTIFSFQPLLR